MIRISQLKLPYNHNQDDLLKKAAKVLRIPVEQIKELNIIKQSIDARKKSDILFIYTVDIFIDQEQKILKKIKSPEISAMQKTEYLFPENGEEFMKHQPVIIGCGPAGLFSGLMLAKKGYRPILLEQGQDVDSRQLSVKKFWEDGILCPQSNVQFGEGGAGTFSDGKLNTLVKDPFKRNNQVMKILVEAGADPSILYVNKPHIGTDVLCQIVKNMRRQIIEAGGQVYFNSKATDILMKDGHVSAVEIGGSKCIDTEAVILAIGHSARDTFHLLMRRNAAMSQKPFAVGLRIQHPQAMINLSQYGMKDTGILGAASYKLTKQASTGRGVYSFCMCPGGYVVNASSEYGRIAVNGMSNHDRAGENANSALIVTVTPKDFGGASPLSGIEYQRKLEETAYKLGNGKIPTQLYGDFKDGKPSKSFGDVNPAFKGHYQFADLKQLMPKVLADSLVEGVESFEQIIHGFARYDAILAGIESRTSSPVRIERDDRFESNLKGLYPCGEGAGYAGGITSAAMDGLKVAEAIVKRFAPPVS